MSFIIVLLNIHSKMLSSFEFNGYHFGRIHVIPILISLILFLLMSMFIVKYS